MSSSNVRGLLVLIALGMPALVVGCAGPAGQSDAALIDVGHADDGGARDSGAADASRTDSGGVDSGVVDSSTAEAGATDASTTDSGATDGGDASVDGAMIVDAGGDAGPCVSPVDPFPAPTGALGAAVVDVSGGQGGGNGGTISISHFGGQIDGSLEVHPEGSVLNVVAPVAPAFVVGAHPVVVSTDTSVPVVSTAMSTGLYVLDTGSAYDAPVYDGAVLVTSIDVRAGATLAFVANAAIIHARVEGDIRNAGTITAMRQDDASVTAALDLEVHHLLNDTSGVIRLRRQTLGQPTAALRLFATFGSGGQIFNRGLISTRGWDDVDPSGPGATGPSAIMLVAASDLFQGGTVEGVGSDTGMDTGATDVATGADITLRTLAGEIRNAGTIDASGGRGQSPRGGNILVFNGGELNDGNRASVPIGGTSYPPALGIAASYGPGGFAGSGVLAARGGDADAVAGDGGSVSVRMVGGNVISNALMDVSGGSTADGTAGRGGNLSVGAYAWVGLDGTSFPIAPRELLLGPAPAAAVGSSGSLLARGGAGGGVGGQVEIVLDVALTGDRRESPDREAGRLDVVQPYDLTDACGTSRLQLVGLGTGLVSNGGAFVRGDGVGGAGGTVLLTHQPCRGRGEVDQCTLPSLGRRLVASRSRIDARGGSASNGVYSAGGSGGSVAVRLDDSIDLVTPTRDTVRVETGGPIALRGGDATATAGTDGGFAGGIGGTVEIMGTNLSTIDVRGGRAIGLVIGSSFPSYGGTGGAVHVFGDNAMAVDASGGSASGGFSRAGGDGGSIEVDGVNSACLNVNGGVGVPAGAAGSLAPAALVNHCE